MATVLLTIVFFASAANLQFKTEIEMVDATTCSAVAERWRAFQDGMLRVIDARCAGRDRGGGAAARRQGELIRAV